MLSHLIRFAFSSEVQQSVPAQLQFPCPICARRDATGSAHDRTERFKFLHLISLGTGHSTWVTCAACGVESRSTVPVAELFRHTPGELGRFIRPRLPLPVILLLIVGGITVFLPFMCFIFSIPALAFAWKYRGWARRLALIEFTVGAVLSVAFAIAIPFLMNPPPKKPTFAPTRPTAPAQNPKP